MLPLQMRRSPCAEIVRALNHLGIIADRDGIVWCGGDRLVLRFDHEGQITRCAFNGHDQPWPVVLRRLRPQHNPGWSVRAQRIEQLNLAAAQRRFKDALTTLGERTGWRISA